MPLSPRKFLQYSQILELFSVQIRNAIYAGAEYRNLKRGDYVFHVGDEGLFMAGVMSGRLKMCVRSREGKEILITMIERGEMFGEMSLLDEMPRAVDVVAEADTTLIVIRRDEFMPFLRNNPDAMLNMIKMVCHRMRLYVHTLELIGLQNLTAKLGRYLLRLANDYGIEQSNGSIIINAGLSQSDIGQQLACSRESINKQLHIFAENNLLELNGDTITLLDIEGLKLAITS